MTKQTEHPAVELAQKLRSCAQTGRKLRLFPHHVAVLMSAPIYQLISDLEAEEIRRACAAAVINDNSVETSGCGSDRTTAPGASAGSNIVPLEVASRGAKLRLAEAKSEVKLRKKQSTL